MQDLLQSSTPHVAQLNKLQKADYHGCLMTIVKSKVPTLVGQSGIVIKDTENMFYLVTAGNRLKKFPKLGSNFTFMVGDTLFSLFGSQFRHRPGERVTKKIKNKVSVEL